MFGGKVSKRVTNNKRITIGKTVFGSIRAACAHFRISEGKVYNRLKIGWTIDEAFGVTARAGRSENMSGVVYSILHRASQQRYIGITVIDARSRFVQHCRKAFDGGSTKLHVAIRKYGAEAFTVRVLCTAATLSELQEAEKHYIAKYKSDVIGLNSAKGGALGGGFKMPVKVNGKNFNSQAEAARSIGISDVTLRDRIRRGLDVGMPKQPNGRVILHDGVEFPSFPALAAHLGMTPNTVRWRYYNGKSLSAPLHAEKSRV